MTQTPNINYGKCTTGINVEAAEKHYGAKYIGDFCVRQRSGNWSEVPLSIFYVETPSKPEYSNYFGLYVNLHDQLLITDGASAFDQPIEAVTAHNGEIVYSRYRHDFRYSSDTSVWVDGGRDYLRTDCVDRSRWVKLRINKDKLEVMDED